MVQQFVHVESALKGKWEIAEEKNETAEREWRTIAFLFLYSVHIHCLLGLGWHGVYLGGQRLVVLVKCVKERYIGK